MKLLGKLKGYKHIFRVGLSLFGLSLVFPLMAYLVLIMRHLPHNAEDTLARCHPALKLKALEAARKLPHGLPEEKKPPRTLVSHFVIPRNEIEAHAMQGMGVLGLRVFAQEKKLLPIRKVVWARKKGLPVWELPFVFPGRGVLRVGAQGQGASPRDREISQKLGGYTQGLFLFFPLVSLIQKGSIHLHLPGKSRVEVIHLPLGGWKPPGFLQEWIDPQRNPTPQEMPDPRTTVALLKSGFCWNPASPGS